jgi:hypothetical protein
MMTALARSFRRRILLLMLPMLPVSATPVVAQEWLSARPDGHAPLGVMGDHTHEKGEVMLSYRFMPMQMDGNRDGTESLTPADVLTQFPVTPLRMPMSMHMFGVMVAPTEKLTITGMVPVIDASMDHMTRPGSLFTTSAAGVGDIKLSGLVRLFNSHHRTAHLNLGFSMPTGATDKTDVTPAVPLRRPSCPTRCSKARGRGTSCRASRSSDRPIAGHEERRHLRRFASVRTTALSPRSPRPRHRVGGHAD